MTRVMNFNPGPAAMPLAALEQAQEELLDFADTGMSIMEHSHRGKEYEAVHNEAIALLCELLDIPADYQVLFLQGGASQQFAQVPMNLLPNGGSADYVLTGSWSEKALGEARLIAAQYGASVNVAASTAAGEGKAKTYIRVPDAGEINLRSDASYVHLTSNETIHGVQFGATRQKDFPDTGSVPLVADMSSDFLWRKFDVSRFGLIYAGAQKNVGPAGVLVAVVRKDLIERGRRDIPVIFQYRTHADNNSLYNTPPTFAVYVVRNVLAGIRAAGGLESIEAQNREKARLLYEVIDSHADFYRCPVEQSSRSVMNVIFRLPSEDLESEFLAEAQRLKMVGLKGHRSVGGIRVSCYNAVCVEWVQALARFMGDFARGR